MYSCDAPLEVSSFSTFRIVPPVAIIGSHTRTLSSGAKLEGSLFRYTLAYTTPNCGEQPTPEETPQDIRCLQFHTPYSLLQSSNACGATILTLRLYLKVLGV